MTPNTSPKYSQIKAQQSPGQNEVNHISTNGSSDGYTHGISYVMLADSQNNSVSDIQEEICDTSINDGCDHSNDGNVTVIQSKLNLHPPPNNGYITIEIANNS